MESFGACLCGKPISWESSKPGVLSLPLESTELLRSCRRSRDPMLCESAISRWATPYIFLLFLLTHPFLTDNPLWVVCRRERSFCPEVFRANKGVMAVVGEFLATPARWYAPRIKWRLTRNSCSRSITNCEVKTDPKCSMKSPANGEKAENGRLLHISPRFVELRQLLWALSDQRAMCCCWAAGNKTTRKSLLCRAPQFCLVRQSKFVWFRFLSEIEENLELFPENDEPWEYFGQYFNSVANLYRTFQNVVCQPWKCLIEHWAVCTIHSACCLLKMQKRSQLRSVPLEGKYGC